MINADDSDKLSHIWHYTPIAKVESLPGKIPVSSKSIVFGIELELEEVKYKEHVVMIPSTWKITEDNSLKMHGAEFISVPLKQIYLETELTRIFSALANFHSSLRCSTHVHMNARDFTLKELATFVLIYCVFEKSLFNFAAGSRYDNFFCVPLFEQPNTVKTMLLNLEQGHYHSMYWHKYSALNLCPIWGGDGSGNIGTVEFRHMNATDDVAKIVTWVNLIGRMKLAAKKISYVEMKEHIRTMNTTSGYGWLVKEVFGNWSKHLTEQPTFKEDVETCIGRTKFAVFKI